MSQSNGTSAAPLTNHKLDLNDAAPHSDDATIVFQQVETLVSSIKQNFTLISQQFNQLLQHTESLKRIHANTQSERDRLDEELKQLRSDGNPPKTPLNVNADDFVFLDVGGQHFKTKAGTLVQRGNSPFFQALLAGEWSKDTNTEKTPIFIDRDGHLFYYVLQYLRTNELNVDDVKLRKELLTEARYYQVQGLEDKLSAVPKKEEPAAMLNPLSTTSQSPPCSPILGVGRTRSSPYAPAVTPVSQIRTTTFSQSMPSKSKPHPAQTASSWRASAPTDTRSTFFPGSTLITAEYEEKLLEFLGGDGQPPQPWRLLYRASAHGFEAADFHRCCETHAPTISIIQTDFGNVFGGFTSVPWSSAVLRADQADPTAFLFTLKNMVGVPPTKFPVAKEFQQCAISHNPTCGPNFGSPKNEGSDLCLRHRFNDKTNCTFFPKSYVDTTNQGGAIFAKKYFACKEVEVFTLAADS